MKKINQFLRKDFCLLAVLEAVLFCLGLAPWAFAVQSGVNFAENQTDTAWAGKGQYIGGIGTVHTNLSYYIVSANAAGPARVQYIDASSDLTNLGKIQFYAITNASITVTNPSNAGTNILWTGSNFWTQLASNDVVVVRSVATDQYQRLQVTNIVTLTNQAVFCDTNLFFALTNGDMVYRCVASATLGNNGLGFNNTNKVFTASGSALYYSQEGYPLLLEVNGTGTAALNAVAGDFFVRENRIR